MKKRLFALLCAALMVISLIACSSDDTKDAPKETEAKTESEEQAAGQDAPELDVKEIYGLSPEGELATLATEMELTDEEVQKIKDGNFKIAICMHQMDNNVNVAKVNLIKETMEKYGVEILTVTDGQSKVEKMIDNLETAMNMEPDLIISIAYDVKAMVPVFQQVKDAGIKLVFFECAPEGFVAGKDYAALVSTDYYGNGRFAAEYMAYLLNYKGKVGIAYYDADVWTCNQRDDAFREVMKKYPDIEVVADQGYAEITDAGTVGDAILAQHPDVDGIYATWDTPAEEIMISAEAAGRSDLIITTVDLGENSSRVLAEGGMIKAIGAPRSYEDGEAIAMSALYALIGKELGAGYVATPTMGVTKENVLEAYETIYHEKPSSELVDTWEKNNK